MWLILPTISEESNKYQDRAAGNNCEVHDSNLSLHLLKYRDLHWDSEWEIVAYKDVLVNTDGVVDQNEIHVKMKFHHFLDQNYSWIMNN